MNAMTDRRLARLRELAAALALIATTVATARLVDPVGPPRRATTDSARLAFASTRCDHPAPLGPGSRFDGYSAYPTRDGGALAQLSVDVDRRLRNLTSVVRRFQPPLEWLDLTPAQLGPVRSPPIARGWPTPDSALCAFPRSARLGFTDSGGLLVDDQGLLAEWHPRNGREHPTSTGERLGYRLEDLWWLAVLAGLLAMAPPVSRQRLTAFGPAIGAALAIVFAAGL